MTPRNAEKFMEWSTGSCGALSASGRRPAPASAKVLNLNIKYPVKNQHHTSSRYFFMNDISKLVLPLSPQHGV